MWMQRMNMKKEYKRNLLIALGITAFLIPMTKCNAENETQAIDESVKNISYDKDEFLEGKSLHVMPEGEKVMMATVTKPVKKVEKVKVVEKKKEVKADEPDESNDKSNNDISYEGTFNVTFYSADYASTGKSKEDKWHGVTASGTKVKEGRTVACPKNIPFGTKVHIEGFGNRICEDRGGAINNAYKLDIYVATERRAYKLGRQKLHVKVYKKEG